MFDSDDSDEQDYKNPLGKSIMHLGAEPNIDLRNKAKLRKLTASTKDGSWSEEDQFETFQATVRQAQKKIKDALAFLNER